MSEGEGARGEITLKRRDARRWCIPRLEIWTRQGFSMPMHQASQNSSMKPRSIGPRLQEKGPSSTN